MILNIVQIPNKILQEKSKIVENMDFVTLQLIENMIDTLHNANGIGLAAVQVGVLLRIVLIDIESEDKDEDEKVNILNTKKRKAPLIFINPEITWKSKEIEPMSEGCLSIPGYNEEVLRHLEIEANFQNINLEKQTIKADGLLAHCLQHEIDHTNGKVFIDYLPNTKKELALAKVLSNRIK